MNMHFSAAQIAVIINGKIEGDNQVVVSSFGKIEEAQAGQISFLANPKYEEFLYTTKASLIIVNESLVLKQPVRATLLRVPDAYSAFARLLTAYQEMQAKELKGIQEPVSISPSASIGERVYIGAFAVIGEEASIADDVKIHPQVFIGNQVSIGKGTIIYPGVKIYQGCRIGEQVIIHAGTVIGSDGFGFAPQQDGTYQKVPQMGNVVIEDQVEIGANCTIDRATIGSTVIHKGAKLDNLIQIAHNVEVGKSSVIAAQTGVSGSTKIGNRVMIGGQVGITGHITIQDGARINAQSGVTKGLKKDEVVNGTPAFNYVESLRSQVIFKQLPELENRLKALEDQLAALIQRAKI